ncbi:inositol 1,4,5-trisphosphate-sensitive calcium-release channel [Aureococcus anophagefferens]|nr:inositol 1,4,5-trisphosphate-sensitive calcium-release channel [Aureococcus anophagefferens]
MGVGGNALFALVACAGFAWQYAWIFLLLDVLLISDDLQNLLKAVILPWRQLALALYSLLVFTAILSVVNSTSTPRTTTGPSAASTSSTRAWPASSCSSFFILVTLLLINVFTGIILDTFSSLREELSGRKEKEKRVPSAASTDDAGDFGIDKEDHETHEQRRGGDHDWLPLDTSFRLEQLAKGDEKRTNVSHDLRPVYDTPRDAGRRRAAPGRRADRPPPRAPWPRSAPALRPPPPGSPR